MKIKSAVHAVALVSIAVIVGLLTGYKLTRGWDHNIDPHYSPQYRIQEEIVNKVSLIMLDQWESNGQHITLKYYPDGDAQYLGEILPLFRHDMHGQFRTGHYFGHTEEFSNLATWIISQGFQRTKNPCPSNRGYDSSVITVTVVFNLQEISRTTCGSYKGYNWFHPIELTITAIHDAASRIHWHEAQK